MLVPQACLLGLGSKSAHYLALGAAGALLAYVGAGEGAGAGETTRTLPCSAQTYASLCAGDGAGLGTKIRPEPWI